MAATLKDLATELGLSISTVSRVLNGKGNFPEKTKQRIKDAAKRMGYSPNIYARYLREQDYRVLGLIVPNVVNPFFGTILQSTEEECRRNGYTLLSGVTNNNAQRSSDYIKFLASNRVNGVILASNDNEKDIKGMHERGMRVVSLNAHKASEEVDWVAIDDYQAMYDLTQYLINLGHKDIACLYGLDDSDIVETESKRLEGYKACMESNNLPINDLKVIGTYENYKYAKEAAQRLLCLPELPTAIVCHNNEIAAGVYDAFTEANFKVPQDVSIACFDSIIPTHAIARQFTCILQPLEKICYTAVQLLIGNELEEDSRRERKRIMIPYYLKTGDTTAPIN